MICKNCGSEIDDNAWECPHCLIDITPAMRQEAMDAKRRQEAGDGPAQVQYAPPPAQQQYAPPPAQQQYGPAAPPRTQYAPPPVMQQPAMPSGISAARQEPVHEFDRPSFYQPPTSFEDDKAEAPIILASIFVPLVGLIMGISNLQKGKKHSGKVYLLLWALIRILPVALLGLIFLLMGFLAAMF